MNLLTEFFAKRYVITSTVISFALLANAFAQKPVKGSVAYKLKAAETIDRHVEDYFKRKQITVPPLVPEEKFLRRTYLALTGRIPTLAEINKYSTNSSPYKADMLAQRLLNSEGYKSHMTNYYFDLFRVKEAENSNPYHFPYRSWLSQSIRENKKWDITARELLTAKGSVWENGAVGYHLRDPAMPLDSMSNTVRIFTGTRMECAQCHDHPHDEKIDRMDFYRLAAFSNGIRSANSHAVEEIVAKLAAKKSTENLEYSKFVEFIAENIVTQSRVTSGTGRIALPKDYQYSDGDPHEIVGARTPFAKSFRMSDRRDGDDGSERLAKWITENNPRFTSVIANRMWKRIMGTGMYEPEDAFVEAEKTTIPRLTKFLSDLMLDLDYDLKEFQNILLLTKVYRYETSELQVRSSFYNQQGRQLRRLTAEQIWDSFVTLKVGNPDHLAKSYKPSQLTYQGYPIGATKQQTDGFIKKVLSAKSSQSLDRLLRSNFTQLKNNRSNGRPTPLAFPKKNNATRFVRSSDIQSPAPLGHMLREFGQSDRELIQNSSDEANVNQILSILNGHVEKLIVSDPKAHVYLGVKPSHTVEQNITNLFLSTLTRKPSKVELIIFKEEIAQTKEKGYRNILAALLTSREFLFLQ